jgi:hypothetical protein
VDNAVKLQIGKFIDHLATIVMHGIVHIYRLIDKYMPNPV